MTVYSNSAKVSFLLDLIRQGVFYITDDSIKNFLKLHVHLLHAENLGKENNWATIGGENNGATIGGNHLCKNDLEDKQWPDVIWVYSVY